MNILLICPNWAGLATPIINELKHQGHSVIHLDHCDLSQFHYFDNVHRLMSKIYSKLSGNNYKKSMTNLSIEHCLRSLFIGQSMFDMTIIMEPNVFNEVHLKIIKDHSHQLVAALWDSLRKSPDNAKYIELFDRVFSYDDKDCEQYDFEKITNYINPQWQATKAYNDAEYDVVSVMSFTKDRYKKAIQFLDANPHLKCNLVFYIDHPRKRRFIDDDRIEVVEHLILGDELTEKISNAKSILDILQGDQSGLSFRAYEAIGYQRKLITTNQYIDHYSIYDSNNIEVLDEDYKVRADFMALEYHPLSAEVCEPYSLQNWVTRIVPQINSPVSA